MFLRLAAILLSLGLLAACEKTTAVTEPPRELGNFALGLNVVVTTNMQKVPISREASGEEWQAAMQKAVAARLGRYQGDKLYNVGISIDGYALAPPGVPVAVKPKSILVISVTLFDDAAGTKLNEKGFQITAFERGGTTDTFIGSGLTRTKEEQMDELSYVAARRVEEWLFQNREWFGVKVDRRTAAPGPTVVSGN
jgi:hypothetical protein